ncbi:DUF4850 domain-containing protein [Paenibacillus gallinarum]|uniref:DUF4850 domain-containing protein n=1 Tax=Paenibacillus gallinarum TaxID=2762232 RepID=A0ABR8SVG1_9BACL|nr:DUF4850 domain-containing protein [Paenibacillus gallinarum]MBD7967493.1 DUF4850 domain-containing protein [Paenibacillus gallinarum]
MMKKSGFKKWIISAIMLPVLAGTIYIIYSAWGDTARLQPLTQITSPHQAVVNSEVELTASTEEVITFLSTHGEEVELPLQIAKADLSVDDGTRSDPSQIFTPTAVSYKIPAELKDELQAVLIYRSDMASGYLLLAPIGWEASAIVGANGSYGVTLTDPGNKEQTLVYSDTAGSCQGCAITKIGTYFPDRAEWADERGFTIYEPLSFTEWNQPAAAAEDGGTATYTTGTSDGYYNTGIASFEKDAVESWYLFRQLEFTLSEETTRGKLQDMVIDFFDAHHGPLTVANVNKEFVD